MESLPNAGQIRCSSRTGRARPAIRSKCTLSRSGLREHVPRNRGKPQAKPTPLTGLDRSPRESILGADAEPPTA